MSTNLSVTHGKTTSGSTESIWISAKQPEFPKLNADLRVEVCVIGGGMAGLTTAYLLAKEGKSVAVLEDGLLCSGETGRTTAHCVNALDDRYFELISTHDLQTARILAESHTAAIHQIRTISKEEDIDAEFSYVDGYLILPDDKHPALLDKELKAAHQVGLKGVELVKQAPIPSGGPALRFPAQAHIHPVKYLVGVAQAAVKHGAQIFTSTHAQQIEDAKDVHPAYAVTSSGHRVTADHIVIATNAPIVANDGMPLYMKQAAYRTYVIGVKVPKGSVHDAMYWDGYWDDNTPYHYIRIYPEGRHDLLIVGGEDHKTGQNNDSDVRYTKLEEWTKKNFPMAGEVSFRWSGQVMEPTDGIAFIGKNPGSNNIYVATGDSGNGMTHGTIAGMLLRDLILGKESAWTKVYDPARSAIRPLKDFAKENLNGASQYKEWVTGGDAESVRNIPKGSGMVLREGTGKIACYRDAHGELHKMSAVCTHRGCIVNWNDGEKSWDCPCHGSRFDPHGKVINGPAALDLEQIGGKKVHQEIARAESISARRAKR
jgi:glycine/D-amino acid oxidase-like deaminating enzyme/nitrite reductase/ring-hydroxylating ferredoxin subunit